MGAFSRVKRRVHIKWASIYSLLTHKLENYKIAFGKSLITLVGHQ